MATPAIQSRLHAFLWFNDQAEDAARFYTSVFDDARIESVTRYPEGTEACSGRPTGSVMTVDFRIEGQRFVALNGGPGRPFTEAISFVVNCASQEEVDRYWNRLVEGGRPKACGWLEDRFGVSWQIVPTRLMELFANSDSEQAGRVTEAMLKMVKLEIGPLEAAYAGKQP